MSGHRRSPCGEQRHEHGHDHGASAHSGPPSAEVRRRLALAFSITLIFLIVEVIGAMASGSLALLSDAAHMATDVIGLGIALGATHFRIRFERRADRHSSRHTYGLGRLEILTALANAALLLGAAAWVMVSAIRRLANPTEVHEETLLIVAALGLVANLASMLVLRSGSAENLNQEGAYLEVLADAVGSVGVIIGGVLSAVAGWNWIDPVIAIVIGLWVLPRTVSLGRRALRILMESAPGHIDLPELRTALEAIDGVEAVHDLHVWTVATGQNAVSAHLMLEPQRERIAVQAVRSARTMVRDRFGLDHSTFQAEIGTDCEPNCE